MPMLPDRRADRHGDNRVEAQPVSHRLALARVAASVSVVTTSLEGTPVGCTISSLVSVSLDPALVLICLERQRALPRAIARHGCFAVNALSDDQQALALRFAGLSPTVLPAPPRTGRFHDLQWWWSGGLPALEGCVALLHCRPWASYDGGDHHILVGEVTDARAWPERHPLVRFDRAWARVVSGDEQCRSHRGCGEAFPTAASDA